MRTYYDKLQAFAALCHEKNMHGLFVQSSTWLEEVADRADGIPPSCPLVCLQFDTGQAFTDGCAVFLYDSYADCLADFNRVLGADYRAPIQFRTYAVTCDNLGNLLHENT